MFQQLMKQVTQLAIDTEERLKGVIDLIFEKAISEPNFSVAYANMCRCLMAVSFRSSTFILCPLVYIVTCLLQCTFGSRGNFVESVLF